MRYTTKQRNIMALILQRASDGVFLTVTEIHAQVKHGADCSYGAIRLSLDILEKAGMILRERVTGTTTKFVKPTALAYKDYGKFVPEAV